MFNNCFSENRAFYEMVWKIRQRRTGDGWQYVAWALFVG